MVIPEPFVPSGMRTLSTEMAYGMNRERAEFWKIVEESQEAHICTSRGPQLVKMMARAPDNARHHRLRRTHAGTSKPCVRCSTVGGSDSSARFDTPGPPPPL